jgi:hypothetical protein
MWLKLFMDDYHLNNIAKVKNQQKLGQIIILGKTKTCNYSEIGNIFFMMIFFKKKT